MKKRKEELPKFVDKKENIRFRLSKKDKSEIFEDAQRRVFDCAVKMIKE